MRYTPKIRANTKSWTIQGRVNPRVAGVFYYLRLYRKNKNNGSVLELDSRDGVLKFNPVTGVFTANIKPQDSARVEGAYLYEFTENANGAVTLLQKGEITISALALYPRATSATGTGGETTTPVDDPLVDDLGIYLNTLQENLGNPNNPSPLD